MCRKKKKIGTLKVFLPHDLIIYQKLLLQQDIPDAEQTAQYATDRKEVFIA